MSAVVKWSETYQGNKAEAQRKSGSTIVDR